MISYVKNRLKSGSNKTEQLSYAEGNPMRNRDVADTIAVAGGRGGIKWSNPG